LWTGAIAVQQIASNAVLTANDGQGHSGSSAVFNVGAYAPIVFLAPHYSTSSQLQLGLTGGNKYQILVSTNLLNWTVLTTLTNSAGGTNYFSPAMNLPRGFYRAVQLP
jgi:Flp pilus assembly protein TadG